MRPSSKARKIKRLKAKEKANDPNRAWREGAARIALAASNADIIKTLEANNV